MENCAVRGKLTVRSGMRILREGDDPASRLCLSGPPLCPLPPPPTSLILLHRGNCTGKGVHDF